MPLELDWSAVVAKPPAGDEFGHLCEPRALYTRSGEILVSYRAGRHRESDDGSPRLVISADQGRSWAGHGAPFERYRPAGWDFRRASMTEVRPGIVLAGILAINKSSGLPTHNAQTEGALPIHALFARSSDFGRTWDAPQPMNDVGLPQLAVEQLLTADDGAVLCAYERFKPYEQPGPWHYQAGLIRSMNDGASWRDPVIAAATDYANDPHETMWWDPRPARLADGRLVQCYYCFRHGNGTEGPLHVAWSADSGRSWSAPCPTPLAGQVGYPITLARGGLVVFQQRRTDQTMRAVFSPDGGHTFEDEKAIVHCHTDYSAPAADGTLAPADYMRSMAQFTFGHPSGAEIAPDRIFVCWYAGSLTRTSIMGAVLTVHRRW